MAAEACRTPHSGECLNLAQRLRRIFAAFEPWYDWGKKATIWRLDAVERDFSDESTGEAYLFEIQWFGLHLAVVAGRTPRKLDAEEAAANKAFMADYAAKQAAS